MTKKENGNSEKSLALIEMPDAVFFNRVAAVVEQARKFVARTADLVVTVSYYTIGQIIVEREQGGKARAEYGSEVMKGLTDYLTDKFKKGFSLSNIKNAKLFYLTYKTMINEQSPLKLAEDQKRQTVYNQFCDYETISLAAKYFKLSWSHYIILMRIKNDEERAFYEREAANEGWSVRQLQHQYDNNLYERLVLSRDKNEVMRLSREDQTIEKPRNLLKSPLVLEFLGMAESAEYSETELEGTIISKLQDFLLEIDNGFLFYARQKRFTFDEDSFFVDLVYYNRFLKCFVLIDIKMGKLEHQDLGQMLMYVNYFDRYVKTDDETLTIGLFLCKEKNDSIVEITLPKNAKIYASKYGLYLPDKDVLQRKLAEWIQEFADEHGTNTNGDGNK
jgi:predicted nuclease of restriction endonuclease-like (RecB) superfamily